MLINVLGTFAQADGEMIGERTAAALAYKRDRLEVYASVPFGFKRRL
jgi:DNA invertase Pin-like site-specific DNA recombinase